MVVARGGGDGGRQLAARRDVDAPYPGTLSVAALHDPLRARRPAGRSLLLNAADFLSPDSLQLGRTGSDDARAAEVAADASSTPPACAVEQRFARRPRTARGSPTSSSGPQGRGRPTATTRRCCTATAASRSRRQPFYSGAIGRAWTARGGVFVLANIRGGGEFGPAWHQAAVRRDKQKSYDDFAAVAEDLIATQRHAARRGWASRAAATAACWSAR